MLPRKHGADSQWRDGFPDAQERDSARRALGNLVLVTKAQNDKAGNLDFARKKRRAVQYSRARRCWRVNEYVRQQTEWKWAQIVEREARAAAPARRALGYRRHPCGQQMGPPRGPEERKEPQAAGA